MSLLIRELELSRGDGVRLVGPLDLNLHPGDRVALLGESGSGKSLLAQAILGMLPAGVHYSGGAVEAFGCRMDQPSPGRNQIRERRLAWIPQDPMIALNPWVRIQDHLTLLPWAHRQETPRSALLRLKPLLERLHLPQDPAFLRRFPLELSGGQRQRVVLAMALSCDPEILLLDEPTSALDLGLQGEFLGLMAELQRERNLGWLWITHDLEVAAAISEQVVVVYGGKALEAGPTAALLSEPRHPYTRRLREAHLGQPSRECGFLEAPERRPAGCPFQPRCPETRTACTPWHPWKGHSDHGVRCNRQGGGDEVIF